VRRSLSTSAVVLFALLAFAAVPARCQERTPEPYTEEEFPLWARDLWRAEVIFVGSLPFSLFLTFEIFDTYRYFVNDQVQSYAPWPFRQGEPPAYTKEETTWLAVSALGVSLAVCVADFLLGRLGELSETR